MGTAEKRPFLRGVFKVFKSPLKVHRNLILFDIYKYFTIEKKHDFMIYY